MNAPWLPEEQRDVSPLSGWSRSHWESTADHMLAAIRSHTSPGGSFVVTSIDQTPTTGLEGFARAALLAAYRTVGTDDPRVRDPLLSWLGRGVEIGCSPGQPESWPTPSDRHQAIVEAAWIAIALSETRSSLWEQLPLNSRRNVVNWLASVQGKAVYRNNWMMYPVIVDAFLEQVAGRAMTAQSTDALRQMDAMHHRDGWYSDGPGSCFGHYSAWGMQLLLAHWLRMTGGEAFPGGPDVIRERLNSFLAEYAYFIGSDGGPVLHGRSLVYRFAGAAPFWLGQMLEATPFSPGQTRRICSGMLRHFAINGALDEGIPPLGWYGSFPAIADGYSTPLSPLLASQAFVGLLLPPSHPVWTAVEQTVPTDESWGMALEGPGLVAIGEADGVIRIASHGASSPAVANHPGYRRVSYSNRSAPATGPLGDEDIDGQITVFAQNGTKLRRRNFNLLSAGDRYAASSWIPRPDTPSIDRTFTKRLMRRLRLPSATAVPSTSARDDRCETASLALAGVEVRVTHLWSLDGGTIRDGGLPASHDEPPMISEGDGWCLATTAAGLTSGVIGLYGWRSTGHLTGVDASPFGSHTEIPYIDSPFVLPEAILITAHVLTQTAVDPEAVRDSVTVEIVSNRCVILGGPGGVKLLVQLYRPARLDRRLGNLGRDGVYRYARWSPDGSSYSLSGS